jgi:hypothetical protein
MHPHRSKLAFVAILAAACSGTSGNPDGPLASDIAPVFAYGEAPPVTLPFTGRCETTFNPPTLPPPRVHIQTDTGTCRLTHLGAATFRSVKEINFMTGTQTTTEATFTAADGDTLRAVGSGTSAPAGPGRIAFSATLTFTGGTGRFLDATGHAQVEGVAHLASTSASLEVTSGSISYRAANRRR